MFYHDRHADPLRGPRAGPGDPPGSLGSGRPARWRRASRERHAAARRHSAAGGRSRGRRRDRRAGHGPIAPRTTRADRRRRGTDRSNRVPGARRDPGPRRPAPNSERRRPRRTFERQDDPCPAARRRGAGRRGNRRLARSRAHLRSRRGRHPWRPARMAGRPGPDVVGRGPGDGRRAPAGSCGGPPAGGPALGAAAEREGHRGPGQA